MKKKIYAGFGLVWLIGVFIIYYYANNYHFRNLDQKELEFFNTPISGVLGYCNSGKDGVIIQLKGDQSKYRFHGSRISDGRAYTFCDDAEKGDSLFKKENNDTLILIKTSGEQFFYKFNISR